MKAGFFIFALATLLAGCASGPYDVSKFSGERRIKAEDQVLIRLDPESEHRIDPGIGRMKFITGTVWKSVFLGPEGAPWVFTVKSAEIENSSPIQGLGFTGRTTYRTTGILRGGGKEYEIQSVASRDAAVMGLSAMRQAIELAVVDAAKQCDHIVKMVNNQTASTPQLGAP